MRSLWNSQDDDLKLFSFSLLNLGQVFVCSNKTSAFIPALPFFLSNCLTGTEVKRKQTFQASALQFPLIPLDPPPAHLDSVSLCFCLAGFPEACLGISLSIRVTPLLATALRLVWWEGGWKGEEHPVCFGHALNMFFLGTIQEILSRFHSLSRLQPFYCLQDVCLFNKLGSCSLL